MDNASWTGAVAFLLVAMQALSLYNTFHTAAKNHAEPMEKINSRLKDVENHLMKVDLAQNELKRDIDHAHEKIRENEKTSAAVAKAQNKALLAILLWIKDPQHGDAHEIDEAIKGISA